MDAFRIAVLKHFNTCIQRQLAITKTELLIPANQQELINYLNKIPFWNFLFNSSLEI